MFRFHNATSGISRFYTSVDTAKWQYPKMDVEFILKIYIYLFSDKYEV